MPGADDAATSAFYEQMFHLVGLAQRMPASSLALLIKIIGNVLRADAVPEGHKYRKLKLDSDKVQKDVVAVEGAVEILLAVGFQFMAVEGGEESLVCPAGTDMTVARLALEKLTALADARR